MTETLAATLGNKDWLARNEDGIKKLLPDTWTHAENLGPMILKIGFGIKVLGVPWSTTEEFGRIMVFFERIGLMQRQNGYQVRANPSRGRPAGPAIPDCRTGGRGPEPALLPGHGTRGGKEYHRLRYHQPGGRTRLWLPARKERAGDDLRNVPWLRAAAPHPVS